MTATPETTELLALKSRLDNANLRYKGGSTKADISLADLRTVVALVEAAIAADPDAMNEKRAAEDVKLTSNVREACAAAVAAEPAIAPFAWTIPGDDQADCNGFIPTKISREGEFTKPLYAAPPVRGDREAITNAIISNMPTLTGLSKAVDAILSLPVQPGAGERGSDAAEADRYFEMAGKFGNHIQRAVEAIDNNILSINRSVAVELKKILDPENAFSRQAPHSSDGGGR